MDAELEQAIKQARYQFKVKYGNRVCSIQDCHSKATDAHHVLVTRHPDHPLLYHPCNMVMICNYHHVPPTRNMNYACVLWMLTKGRRKHWQIKQWIEGLPFKEKPTLPDFYYDARKNLIMTRRAIRQKERRWMREGPFSFPHEGRDEEAIIDAHREGERNEPTVQEGHL